ncbi:hypothetical protein N7488_010771 [Penicillium malachiteum]|nr:hypothetical protein N7488_010771 [Penicillium malachiteum]
MKHADPLTCLPFVTSANINRRQRTPSSTLAHHSQQQEAYLSEALAVDVPEALFSVGDKIDLTEADPQAPHETHERRGPVTIRWDSGIDRSNVQKISFPAPESQIATTNRLALLLEDCEPATFGRGSEEVLDKSYRLASKMDVQHFSCDFSPHDNGVMEKVRQALAFRDYTGNSHRGLRAELYKLNVYSAPSGMFKTHVDTPRSENQMGSLVVCLPSPHEGGELIVRRQGRKRVYSWARSSASHIQWAAFYSDEEHEVAEVTKGHRVTLTYNLYWVSDGPTSMASLIEDDLGLLSWVVKLDELSKCKLYLRELGTIGFRAIQFYPHSASSAARGNIEEQLKGLDMLVYQALKRLGGNVRVTPVIDDIACNEDDGYYELKSNWHGSSDPNIYHPSQDQSSSGECGSKTPSEVGEYYVGKGFHSPFLEDQITDDGELPSPGQFGRNYDYHRGNFSEAWYRSKRVTWLNKGPKYGGRELAMTAIVVSAPLKAPDFIGSIK